MNPVSDRSVAIYRAMDRSRNTWHVQRSHTEDEQAYLDRALLADELTRTQRRLAEAIDALGASEREVSALRESIQQHLDSIE